MMLRDQVFAQALLLAGDVEPEQEEILGALATAATASLTARLRDGLSPEDCKADFIAAASLYALAALSSVQSVEGLEQITAGDLTLRKSTGGRDAASNCLRNQAELMITPYLKDRFCFKGV